MFQNHEATVRKFFSQPGRYLHRRFGIRIREDIIAELTAGLACLHVLDLGCGDGSLSRMFVDRAETVTLVDLAQPMLDLARDALSAEQRRKVRFHCGGSETLAALKQEYDLAMLVGLLAHVPDVAAYLATAAEKMIPGGHLLLQFGEANHPLIRLERRMGRANHRLNQIELPRIEQVLAAAGFNIVKLEKCNFQLPGFGRLPDGLLYRYESLIRKTPLLSKTGADYFVLAQKRK